MSRARMTMRAQIERNAEAGTDDYGHPLPADFQPLHAALPCFVWSRQGREAVDGDKTALVEDLRAMFPKAADVAERDEIVAVKDRRGNVLFGGRLRIDAPPQFKHRHVEAALKRVA